MLDIEGSNQTHGINKQIVYRYPNYFVELSFDGSKMVVPLSILSDTSDFIIMRINWKITNFEMIITWEREKILKNGQKRFKRKFKYFHMKLTWKNAGGNL